MALGPQRTILAAYSNYRKKRWEAKRGQKKPFAPPTDIGGAFREWKSQWKWDERCADYERDEQVRLREIQQESDAEKYVEDLKQFRDMQIESGKAGLATAKLSRQILQDFMNEMVIKINSGKKISIDEAERLAKIGKVAGDNSAEQFAQGLQIDKLLEEIDA